MRRRLLIAAVMLGLLAGCGSAPRSATGKVPLGDEQRRLAELFRGTPVVFQMQSDGSLRVEVPLRYAFDRGASAVKPPLAAVLDRIALGQRGQPTRVHVAAPGDPGARNTMLARDRAVSTRGYLMAHGIAVTRFAPLATAGGEQLEITVAD